MSRYSDDKPLSFIDALQLLLIYLKLTHQIDWAWVFVAIPFWVSMIYYMFFDKD